MVFSWYSGRIWNRSLEAGALSVLLAEANAGVEIRIKQLRNIKNAYGTPF